MRIAANHPVKVRPETKAKLNAITADRRWTFAECVDALADEFIERHGIQLPERAKCDPSATVRANEPNSTSSSVTVKRGNDSRDSTSASASLPGNN